MNGPTLTLYRFLRFAYHRLRGKFPSGEALVELERNPVAGLPVRRGRSGRW